MGSFASLVSRFNFHLGEVRVPFWQKTGSHSSNGEVACCCTGSIAEIANLLVERVFGYVHDIAFSCKYITELTLSKMDIIFQPQSPTNHNYNQARLRVMRIVTWLSKPKMLAHMLYAIQFMVLMSSSTNCLQFGALVLRADLEDPQHHQRLLRFFATTLLTSVCLVLYFNNYYFRKLNILFACLKVILIFVIIGSASYVAITQDHKDFSALQQTQPGQRTVVSSFLAFLNVLFAFNGWENATFVPSSLSESYISTKIF